MAEDDKNKLEIWLRMTSALLAIAAFCWGIYTYRDNATRTARIRQIETARPFLDLQLNLYVDLMKVTSTIATSSNPDQLASAKQRFWELYYGEVALVERISVAKALVSFGEALRNGASQHELGTKALSLAVACRDELAVSWGVDAWKSHQPAL